MAIFTFCSDFGAQNIKSDTACNAGDQGTSLGWEDALEKGTAAQSNILA